MQVENGEWAQPCVHHFMKIDKIGRFFLAHFSLVFGENTSHFVLNTRFVVQVSCFVFK